MPDTHRYDRWNKSSKDRLAVVERYDVHTHRLAVWRSCNTLVSINKVTLRRARLLSGWVTSSGWTPGAVNLSVCNQPSRSTQLGHPFLGRRSEYQPLWLHSLVCVLLHTTPQIHKECTWLVSAWNCPLTPIFGRILEHSSPNDVTHCTSSEKDTHSLEKRCLETHGLSWMAWKSVQRLKLGVSSRKAAGQSKESWRGYISPT